MSLRYIGSKARVSAEIGEVLGPWPGQGRFIDAFCGTGSVAREAASLGWPLVLNDHLTSSVAVATAQVISSTDVHYRALGGYGAAIASLNELSGASGFIWREYSPASATNGVERRYFTESNAARIDAMRHQIGTWSAEGKTSTAETQLLIADLLAAANRVANIAGTYGCFLRYWTSNALRELQLVPRQLPANRPSIETSCLDVFELHTQADDTVYLDPPYTKRQYAAYYHILETIAEGDTPQVGGITGLRPWEHKASPFCYKKRALGALVSLISKLPAHRVLISYSNEGHVALDDLRAGLAGLGTVQEHELASVGRYRPNEQASANGSSVEEYLLDIRPAPTERSRQTRRPRGAAA